MILKPAVKLVAVTLMLMSVLFTFSASLAQDETRSAADFVEDGTFNLERSNCQFAQSFFQQALELEPDNAEAALGKGRALVCQGAYEAGITELQNVVNANSGNVEAKVFLAEAYRAQYDSDPEQFAGRLGDALGVIQEAEQAAPDNARLLNVKGIVFYNQGEMASAREAFERSVTLAGELSTEDQALININLGKTYLQQGEQELALQVFQRAVALNPASAQAHNNVGAAYFALGNCEQAIYELTQAVNLNERSADAAFNLGRALFECDQVEASVERFEAGVELPSSLNVPQLYTYLSRAYAQLGRFDEAVSRAQQGAILPPASAEGFYYLGQAFEKRNASGDMASARDAYESALELDESYQPAQDALSRLGE